MVHVPLGARSGCRRESAGPARSLVQRRSWMHGLRGLQFMRLRKAMAIKLRQNPTPLETKVTTLPPHSGHGMGGIISPCCEEEAEEVMAADMVSLLLGWREGRIWRMEGWLVICSK